MADWSLLTREAEQALTLTDAERAALHSPDPGRGDAVSRLVQRARAAAGFLATSAPGEAAVAEAALLRPGAMIGPWQAETLVGRGGMGEVWKAIRADGLFEQVVALKLMQAGGASRIERFEQERRRLARMEHPGIARILDGGLTPEGVPWMAMEYVCGRPIDEATAGWSPSRKLALFADLCEAVQHAHGRLILHRDIKPSNILVDDAGSVRLIDFGISSAVDEADAEAPLTIRTAAPEQLFSAPVSIATDIWALGVVLHRLLADAYPERQADASVAIDAGRIASSDLRAILAKALALSPDDRYRSAADLGADVRAFLGSRPVEAREGGAVYRLAKSVRRFPLASALAALSVLALVGGLAASLSFAAQARRGEAQAKASLARSEFFFERSEHFAMAREAYADALQRLYGQGADVERHSRVLIEAWREAFDHRTDDPAAAAYASFSLGRHFLSRNDYQTARSILEPWVDGEYGPQSLLVFGRALLATVYLNLGESDRALALFRSVEASFAASYDADTPDHVATVTKIAEVTKSAEEAARAEAVLLRALEKDATPEIKAFFLGQLHVMRKNQRDLPGAREALLALGRLVEASPLMNVGDRDLAWIQIANFEYFYGEDIDRARKIAAELAYRSREERGENRETGRALILLGLLDADEGRTDDALGKIADGVALIERYGGPTSGLLVNAHLSSADILVAADRFEDAERVITGVAAGMAPAAAAG